MSLTRTPFWFLRHGETDWNADNLAQGGTDIPLNARGRVQAETAAQVLRNRSIAAIVASPLSRATRRGSPSCPPRPGGGSTPRPLSGCG